MVPCSMGVFKSKLGRGEAVYLWDKLAVGCKHPIVKVKISYLELN